MLYFFKQGLNDQLRKERACDYAETHGKIIASEIRHNDDHPLYEDNLGVHELIELAEAGRLREEWENDDNTTFRVFYPVPAE